jgi:hypothetical protein
MTPEQYLKAVPKDRQAEARAIFEFISECVPDEKPFVIKNIIGFGMFHYRGKSKACEGDWMKVGMACNKASLSVYSCATGKDGQMLPEKYASQLGKVEVGKSCIRFKKWEDVNKQVLRKLLKESMKCPFAFG